jgi:hypothetical protein
MPIEERAAETLERADGSMVEKAAWRDDSAEEAAASMLSREPLSVASARAEEYADWSEGDRSESEDWRAAVSIAAVRDERSLDKEARSTLCAYVYAAKPATMAVEKRMLFAG